MSPTARNDKFRPAMPRPVQADAWPAQAERARLHFVTGKGGTGKSTVAAALALSLASGGRKVLLVEVEERQGIAQLFDIPPLPHEETRVAVAEGGGVLTALAIDIETAFLEYLDMFYNLGFAGRAMRKVGAVEFATTLAPGLRDVLLTGKIKECAVRSDASGRHVYDNVVVDAPPTGRIGKFLDVTRAMADLAKGGPIRSQSDGVIRMLHSDDTMVHLVTLLEALPVQETADAVAELTQSDLRIGTVIVNRTDSAYLSDEAIADATGGQIDAESLREDLKKVNLTVSDDDFAGLLTETIEHAIGFQAQRESAKRLDELGISLMHLPRLSDGVDLGGLYELSEFLTEQGVR